MSNQFSRSKFADRDDMYRSMVEYISQLEQKIEAQEAELQEKLRQQRDKCVEAYDNASGDGVIQKQIIKAAIRNAQIDNNGEE